MQTMKGFSLYKQYSYYDIFYELYLREAWLSKLMNNINTSNTAIANIYNKNIKYTWKKNYNSDNIYTRLIKIFKSISSALTINVKIKNVRMLKQFTIYIKYCVNNNYILMTPIQYFKTVYRSRNLKYDWNFFEVMMMTMMSVY